MSNWGCIVTAFKSKKIDTAIFGHTARQLLPLFMQGNYSLQRPVNG